MPHHSSPNPRTVVGACGMALVVLAVGCRPADAPKETATAGPLPEATVATATVPPPALVLRNVSEIRPWREWSPPTPPRRLPPVQVPAIAMLLPPEPEIDPCPVPTSPRGVSTSITSVDEQRRIDPNDKHDEPPTEPQSTSTTTAALPAGTVLNPFAGESEPSVGEEGIDTEPETDDVAAPQSDVENCTPAERIVTDAVVPTHLQESWFQMIRGAYELASRGARFAARQEFEKALYEIAQTKDLLSGGEHTEALARGLRALEEAVDFLPADGSLSAPVQTEILLDGHQTEISKILPTELPATALIDAYHRYAEQQLAEAVGGIRAGSMALHALGKLYDRLAETDAVNCRDAADRSITYQRAAIRAHGGNYLAANELGVLLARGGDYTRARQMFVRSLQIAPSREAQYNLQVTDTRIALAQGHAVAGPPPRTATARVPRRPNVHWLPVDQFVASAPIPRGPVVQTGAGPAPRSAQMFSNPRYRR